MENPEEEAKRFSQEVGPRMPENNEENTVGRKCSSSGTRTNIPCRNSSARTVTYEMTIL